MMKFLIGAAFGAVASYSAFTYNLNSIRQTLGSQEQQMVQAYIHHHKLQKLLKLSILRGYMKMNKAFLDYGVNQKLQGFYYYDSFFEKDQLDSEKITKIHCIFSPKQQLCGHPNIQHGGVTATIADQNTGLLAMLFSNSLVATADLFVKYTKPVKKGQLYVCTGQIQSRQERKIFVNFKVKQLETGIECANGLTLMMTVNWQHKMGEVFQLLFKAKNTTQAI